MTDERIVELGKTIRQLRQDRCLTQEALAGLSGLEGSYISHVERGSRNASIRNIFRIADALGVAPVVLFERKKDK